MGPRRAQVGEQTRAAGASPPSPVSGLDCARIAFVPLRPADRRHQDTSRAASHDSKRPCPARRAPFGIDGELAQQLLVEVKGDATWSCPPATTALTVSQS